MNYKMILEYDGSRYNGWQRQGNTDNTIQGKLEEILSKYFGQAIEVHGSGRTDAGVHALGQVANFKVSSKAKSELLLTTKQLYCDNLTATLNSYLPEDIRIRCISIEDDRFHARLNAKAKTYRYKLCLSSKRNVFERKYSALLPDVDASLDINTMQAAAKAFLGEHDFVGFSDTKTKKSTIRRVDDIIFTEECTSYGHYLTVDFIGNGFLYHTVRLMMGTLISIGLGKCPPCIIDEIFLSKDRKKVPFMAPAEGLFLVKVEY